MTAGEPLDCSQETAGQFVDAVARAQWSGRASQLSEDHVSWSFIDEVARATEDPGRSREPEAQLAAHDQQAHRDRQIDARALLLQRRSAVAFDGRSTINRTAFVDMLSGVLPTAKTPWTSAWWAPRVHLAIFVHRVEDVPPGLYLLLRDPNALDRLRAACRPDFLWEAADEEILEAIWQFRRDFEAATARTSQQKAAPTPAGDGGGHIGSAGHEDVAGSQFS